MNMKSFVKGRCKDSASRNFAVKAQTIGAPAKASLDSRHRRLCSEQEAARIGLSQLDAELARCAPQSRDRQIATRTLGIPSAQLATLYVAVYFGWNG